MNRVERIACFVFAAWLVFGLAFAIAWLGRATGEFTTWPEEAPMALISGLLLFGWLGAFPLVAGRSAVLRAATGLVASPGALVLLLSGIDEAKLLVTGHSHELPVAATYLVAPIVYAWGYYRLARPRPRTAA
jgi:hypothetical protein